MLGIRDRDGLCKRYAARVLVNALRQEVGLPIHFHTHDCSGGQVATLLLAAAEGASVVDTAMAPFSGMTSPPSLNAGVEAVRLQPRDPQPGDEALLEVAGHREAGGNPDAPVATGQL